MLRFFTLWGFLLALLVGGTEAHARGSAKAAREAYREGQEIGNRGDLAGAIGKFEEAVRLDPKMELAYLRLGLAYRMTDRWPESLAAYQGAIANARQYKYDAYDGLAQLYRSMGHLRMAAESHGRALEEARKRKRPFPEGHFELALTYIELRELDDAIRELREALKLRPDYLRASVRLANTLVANDELDEAQTMFEAMLKKNPKDRMALYGLGLIEKRRDNREQSREFFDRACKLGHRASCRETEVRFRTLH